METKYSSLEELKQKKALLKKDVSEMEDLLTFDNTKESLSAFTNGFTDKFLKEEVKPGGGTTVKLDTSGIMQGITDNVKKTVLDRNSAYGYTSGSEVVKMAHNAIKLGAVTYVGKYAKQNLNNSSWKKKAIGLALIYVAPIVLKVVREKLEDYQRNRTTSSMQQLI